MATKKIKPDYEQAATNFLEVPSRLNPPAQGFMDNATIDLMQEFSVHVGKLSQLIWRRIYPSLCARPPRGSLQITLSVKEELDG